MPVKMAYSKDEERIYFKQGETVPKKVVQGLYKQVWKQKRFMEIFHKPLYFLVELRGIEPLTSW
jgi:hypothetical protein